MDASASTLAPEIGGVKLSCASNPMRVLNRLLAPLRPIGQTNAEPALAAMEERLFKAGNALGFGPMGTGGDTTVLGVHVDYSSGHGFTPVAVAFNCWINRRTSVKIWGDGRMEWGE